mgnify:CR=1 FL=1
MGRVLVLAWRGAILLAALGLSLWMHAADSEIVPLERDFTVRVWRKEHGLPDDRVLALLRDNTGFIWVGTRRGVSRFDGRVFKTWSRSTHNAFANDVCQALAQDRDGAIWVGTAGGLIRLGEEPRLVALPSPPTGSPFPPTEEVLITSLATSPAGELLVGSERGLGIRCADGSWRGVHDGPPFGTPRYSAWAIGSDGTVWAGIGGTGLFRRSGPDAPWSKEALPESLADTPYYDDALWIGTDRGLNVLRGGRIAVFTTAHGLPDNLVNGIAEDTRGWLWIGHDRGIYCVKRQDLLDVADGARSQAHCVSYAEEDGLLNPETNGQNSYPPATRLRDGRIAFATMGGVVLFDPDRLPDLTNGPCAHIETLRAGERVIFTGGFGAETGFGGQEPERNARGLASRALRTRLSSHEGNRSPSATETEGALSPERRLTINSADRGLLRIDFTVAAFRAPARVRCRYRLLGLSPDWTDAGTLRQATFSGLRPGDYTFEVTVQNHHGYTSRMPARLSFSVEPLWRERAWVRLGGAVLLPALIAVAVRRRMRALRRLSRLEQQAALARERARLAKDLHDGLGASLTEITLLSGVGEANGCRSRRRRTWLRCG